MCVAIACHSQFPSEADLHRCEEANSDGGGVAWVENHNVRWKKGITAAEIARMIKDKTVTLPALIHFRIASCGGKYKELCHPFPINKTASTALEGTAGRVLIHNGHWWPYQVEVISHAVAKWEKPPAGKWSDTRVIAWLTARLGDGILEIVAHNQKIATLNAARNIELWPPSEWTKESGCFYSNMGWKWHYSDWERKAGVERWVEERDRNQFPHAPNRPLDAVIVHDKEDVPDMTVEELETIYGKMICA